MPGGVAAEAAAAAVSALLEGSSGEPGAAPAQEAVALLAAACQRAAAEPAVAGGLQAAVLQCVGSGSAVARQAAGLLPVLAVQQAGGGSSSGKGSRGPPSWVQPVAAAGAAAAASAAALQRHLARPSLPPDELRHHAALLVAAFQPANALRRALAGRPLPELLGGGAEAVAAAAAQLELLAAVVSTAHRVTAAPEAAELVPQLAALARQGHAAAVGLATAAKMRAAGGAPVAGSVLDAGAAAALLGWDFARYCASG